MSDGLKLPKFSVGVGDRFAHQAKAQLAACMKAAEAGVEVVPVWNKSNREHMIIGSEPSADAGGGGCGGEGAGMEASRTFWMRTTSI